MGDVHFESLVDLSDDEQPLQQLLVPLEESLHPYRTFLLFLLYQGLVSEHLLDPSKVSPVVLIWQHGQVDGDAQKAL